MFDTNKVANNIKTARTKMNMTQMNLADEMGVSYQAVSNWERGNSMPDISKLPELCKILNISFEELVGEKTAETDIVEKLMQDENADVTLEEMAQIGELVKPESVESKVNETVEKGGEIPFSVLVSLAPFMDKEVLGKMAEELADVKIKKLCAIAPFISRETLDKIFDRCIANDNMDGNGIVSIAPFLSKSTIQKVAEYLMAHGQAQKVVAIAPFMGRDMFPKDLSNIDWQENGNCRAAVCSGDTDLDDMDENEVAEAAFKALEKGNDIAEFLDYMDEGDVGRLAMKALELGRETDVFLDYMDEGDVGTLAMKALELGRETDVFLDYMDEDDVEKLAIKALKAGKSIEGYLDYMDEDAIKKLLLKSLAKNEENK